MPTRPRILPRSTSKKNCSLMHIVGSDMKEFRLNGRRITSADGSWTDDEGVLAGSGLDMASAVRNAEMMMEVDFATAARMASRRSRILRIVSLMVR